ncbi:MAG TPA: hypothetical protein VIW67_18265, partial [Terriglobales bacterium]
QQEPNQLIEPPVAGGYENPRKMIHGRIVRQPKDNKVPPTDATTPEPYNYDKKGGCLQSGVSS